MLIRGEANGAGIELSEKDGLKETGGSACYRVTLREGSFEASRTVYAYDPLDKGLAKFFKGLASDWRGWEGVREWSSIDGDFEISCEHDRVGHVTTTTTLHSNRYGHGWMAQIRFGIAAGELELISEEVNRFFVGSSVTK